MPGKKPQTVKHHLAGANGPTYLPVDLQGLQQTSWKHGYAEEEGETAIADQEATDFFNS